jgi:hypothetical protein
MSDYNVPHAQYPQHTLLDESIEYMKLLLNNAVAENCKLLIFFNKKDRFKEKINDEHCRSDIDYLKEYLSTSQYKEYKKTGKHEPKTMYNAITAKFNENIKIKYPNKSCYCRHTCAVDSKIMDSIFATIRNEILNEQFYEVFP